MALKDILGKLLGISAAPPPTTQEGRDRVTDPGLTATDQDVQAQLNSMFTVSRRSPFRVETERLRVLAELEAMRNEFPEVDRGLRVIAENATSDDRGEAQGVEIRFLGDDAERAQAVIDALVSETSLDTLLYGWVKRLVHLGDLFLEVVFTATYPYRIVRVKSLHPSSMERNEDDFGVLERDRAFTQKGKNGQVIATFRPWQMIHLRWDPDPEAKYGRSQLHSARRAAKRLFASENSLALARLDHFEKLVHYVNAQGAQTPDQIRRRLDLYKRTITKRKSTSEEGFVSYEDAEEGAAGQDFFLPVWPGKDQPEKQGVEVISQGSTAVQHLGDLEYWQNKLCIALGVPKALLGLERDVNAKATLGGQDANFSRLIRRTQAALSVALADLVDIALILAGLDPADYPYDLHWPNPNTVNAKEEAEAAFILAQRDLIYKGMGVIGKGTVARDEPRLGLEDEEWKARLAEIVEERKADALLARETAPADPLEGRFDPATDDGEEEQEDTA